MLLTQCWNYLTFWDVVYRCLIQMLISFLIPLLMECRVSKLLASLFCYLLALSSGELYWFSIFFPLCIVSFFLSVALLKSLPRKKTIKTISTPWLPWPVLKILKKVEGSLYLYSLPSILFSLPSPIWFCPYHFSENVLGKAMLPNAVEHQSFHLTGLFNCHWHC